MAKFTPYTVKRKINDTEYVFQFNGIAAWLRAVDDSYIEGTSNTSVEKLNTYFLEHVVVEPKGLTLDDFASIDELNKVTKIARGVAQGEITE